MARVEGRMLIHYVFNTQDMVRWEVLDRNEVVEEISEFSAHRCLTSMDRCSEAPFCVVSWISASVHLWKE